ncbi:RHS repeat protein [Nocardioides plantarum]|uniref:RHS repeat-associated core domain-containing protein n=1 Tax=Nocardioides plantarum TaxID=29299 RepID=A0ABV5K830_9ACTN|nr:RHS repeat-associated core domain-containing protein [Nocardioides plantarum]
MNNRVDSTGDAKPPLARPRLGEFINEAGGITTIQYSPQQCDPTNPPSPATNTQRCFPVYWAPFGGTPAMDWFNKFVVTGVTQNDTTTGDLIQTNYQYAGTAAWRYADDPQLPDAYRTWSDWRGYNRVDTLVGRSDQQRSMSSEFYLRGMDGNRTASGSTSHVVVSGLDAPSITDSNEFAGTAYESVLFNGMSAAGVAGSRISESISTPWSRQTASTTQVGGTIDGKTASPVELTASYVDTQTTVDRTFMYGSPVTNATSRSTTHQILQWDSYGMPIRSESYATPDEATPTTHTDAQCATIAYARNPALNLVALIARTFVQSVACASADTATLPTDKTTSGSVISDTYATYDGATSWQGQVPTLGDATATYRAVGYNDGTREATALQQVADVTYDALGRRRTSTDTNSGTTTTEYNPVGAGVPISTTSKNAKGQPTVTTWDGARMLPLTVVDANQRTTENTYDAIGRLTAVWDPRYSRAQGQAASQKFAYSIGGTAAGDGHVAGTWIATYVPKGPTGTAYNVSYQVFDALLRARQTQKPSPQGGQILTDTTYDDLGRVATSWTDAWDDQHSPTGTRYVLGYGGADQTDNTFDGAGRIVKATESWTVPTPGTCAPNSTRCSRSTTTTYTGDATTVVPPPGGLATTTVVDALGRTTQNITYPGNDPTATGAVKNVTAYDAQGRPKSVTGPDQLSTTVGYDLFGRTVSNSDPASGTSTTTYNDNDQVIATKDARGQQLNYTYDILGRATGLYQGASATNASELASWSYDAAGQLGQLSSTTRYVGGNVASGRAYKSTVNTYDSLYRPTKTTLTLPGNDTLVTGANLPTTVSHTESYNRDGTVNTLGEPAIAGLPAETETYGYDSTGLGLPTTLNGAQGVVLSTGYTPFGDISTMALGAAGTSNSQVNFAYGYDGLRRLTRLQTTDPASSGSHLINASYAYNTAGQLTSVFDSAGSGNTQNTCYSYSSFARLSAEWTPSSANCAAPTKSTIAGAAPYWTSYGFNTTGAGQRTTKVDHSFTGGPSSDTTTTYTYGGTCNSKTQSSRVLTNVRKVVGSTTANYPYCVDASGGQTTSATVTGAARTMAWDGEGHLSNLVQGSGTSATKYTYVYNTDGSLLVKRPTDPAAAGTTTLYLGDTEVEATLSSNGTWALKGTRHYTAFAGTVAVRTATPSTTSTLTFQAADPQGTTNVEWSSTAPGVTRAKRYTDAFGVPVNVSTWADARRFLSLPYDSTLGLSHLGAREYDPQTGRFMSVDPVLNAADPVSMDSYGYSDHDPVNSSDPEGTICTAKPDPDNGSCPANQPTAPHTTHHSGSAPASNTPSSTQSALVEQIAQEKEFIKNIKILIFVHQQDIQRATARLEQDSGGELSKSDVILAALALGLFVSDVVAPELIPVEAGGEAELAELAEGEGAAGIAAAEAIPFELEAELTELETLKLDVTAEESLLADNQAALKALGGVGPVNQGEAGVLKTIADLEAAGGRVIQREVTLDVNGVRTRPDLYVEFPNGEKGFIEVKTGEGARLTSNQTTAYPGIRTGGAIPRGKNAEEAGLEVGRPLPAMRVWIVRQPWP